jgi:hypothetical protein
MANDSEFRFLFLLVMHVLSNAYVTVVVVVDDDNNDTSVRRSAQVATQTVEIKSSRKHVCGAPLLQT